ncbi:GNAT family N-acetyltransferase, partial [Halomonas maura]|uniref:GNAT family N-acetyltransferase n=1 Tax=Halomonas maura TaxID=117606 RepID=UPI0025B60C34
AARRQGLGARLLEAERQQARAAGIDLLGASFGAEPGLLAFWQAQGFRAVRLGLTREAATGEHALMVVQATSEAGEGLARRLGRRFQRQLPALLAFELADLDPGLVLALLAEGDAEPLSDEDRADLDDVAHGHREPALARPALQALVRLAARGAGGDPELGLLAAWAFQGRDEAWLAHRLGLTGSRQVAAWRRRTLAAWLTPPRLSSDEAGR